MHMGAIPGETAAGNGQVVVGVQADDDAHERQLSGRGYGSTVIVNIGGRCSSVDGPNTTFISKVSRQA